MANYSLILDTKFKPFSYAEMLAPVAAATQAHQAIEEEYGNLATKANVWEKMANEQTDPYAYSMYKAYSDDLNARAEQLMRYGLNASSRKGMLDMRARYSKEIVPIEVAYKRREELAAEQRKAMAANPTLRYQRDASKMSLDDLIRNPSLDYGKSYSGALLTQQVAQMAASYAKTITEEGKLESLGLPFQYKNRIRRGASPEDILAVINKAAADGHTGAINFLKTVRDQAIAASGIADWADSSTMKEFTAFANQGLYSAIGQTEIKNYTDQYSMHDKLNARNAQRQAVAQAAARRAAGIQMAAFKDSKLYGLKGNSTKDWENYLKHKFLTKDGKMSTIGLRNAKLGSKISNYIYQAEHAKNEQDKLKYAKLAYRAAYGKDPEQRTIYGGGPDVYKQLVTADNILLQAKNSNQHKFYTSMRNVGISKADIDNKGYVAPKYQELVSTAYNANVGNPAVGALTHTLDNETGKELMTAISSQLGNQKVYNVIVDHKGNAKAGNKGTNLLSLNKDGKTDIFIKHISLVPTSPGLTILTLSNGNRVAIGREQMNEIFGEGVTNSLIRNSNLYVAGNHNEALTALHNINTDFNTAITQWKNPTIDTGGIFTGTWDFGE